jgi:uncharacterized protein (TIGR00730 family)
MYKLNRVSVFCGSYYGGHARYERAARELGLKLAGMKIGIVYSGGKIGLMGVMADAALEAGGEVIGVMAKQMRARQIVHRGLTELLMVESRHERKKVISEISDGFIALPGGFGVLDEFCEMALWTQLELQQKPCGLLNVNHYFNHLIAHFELAGREGFIKQSHLKVVQHDSDLERLLKKMSAWAPLD